MKKLIKPVLLASLLLSSTTAFKVAACDTNPMLGSLCTYGFNFAPRGWSLADGQILSIASNTALFSLLGTTYGGDGRSTFALPDLRGRAVVGTGTGPGLTAYRWGQKFGSEQVSLSTAMIPAHGHAERTASTSVVVNAARMTATTTLNGTASLGDSASPGSSVFATDISGANAYSTAAPDVALAADSVSISLSGSATTTGTPTVSNSGGSQSHYNVMPFQTVSWAIATTGLFPSRS